MMNSRFFHGLTLLSYFGLMSLLLFWILLQPHGDNYPVAAMLIFAVVPLLFPLRGLLHQRPKAYAWLGFLMLFYFTHAVGELYSASGFAFLPFCELLLSISCFISVNIYIKTNAKETAADADNAKG